jgi:hypothetical protein
MAARDTLLEFLRRDLVGPQHGADEVLAARPGDLYLTGSLFPESLKADPEDDDDRDGVDDDDGSPGVAISLGSVRRPSSIGLSFMVEGESPTLILDGETARYQQRWLGKDGVLTQSETTRADERWRRSEQSFRAELPVQEGLHRHDCIDGLCWWVRALRKDAIWHITVVLSNVLTCEPGRVSAEAATFFQSGFSVRAGEGSRVVPRLSTRSAIDEDTRSNDLIYREVSEWAIGHTCAADWKVLPGEGVVLSTTWLPVQHVPSMDAGGHALFAEESQRATGTATGAFLASTLGSEASPAKLATCLGVVPDAYTRWIDGIEQDVARLERTAELTPDRVSQARTHIERARDVARRIQRGVDLLRDDAAAREAFQLSQQAMLRQRGWTERNPQAELVWRPFQLGFQLLAIPGMVSPQGTESVSADRESMDLLWFPTGGGKTEAYLALTAFVLFHRRLREAAQPDAGAGVAVLMRYTLRLLTVQQFERASRMIVACELIRRSARDGLLGQQPIGIGLWVGNDATPSTVEKARTAEGRLLVRQLTRCPCCSGENLRWDAERDTDRYVIRCEAEGCTVKGIDLPIWTIDSEIYRNQPGLVIGTVDKFAQVARNPRTSALFGNGTLPPPELIIQDELHLISGPLGTVAGIYEAAIDQLCTWKGVRPKIIGSTATIRRAEEQVRNLFARDVLQFPPAILDATDSCFAVVDSKSPGRLYLGITTSGRSPKFVLQAACASLMQGASEPTVPEAERDPYWTLVAYFNSLRELGGALVMMHDDVVDSVGLYADQHGTTRRRVDEEPLELTARVPSAEIPEALAMLEKPYPNQPTAVVLATNMISVGVDIPRLGLMVVNGQPKSMSEYIQATSRVGRGRVPGLIVTIYNAGRPRDRSHFEAFRTWHQTLYREVEATSVTPFAPRARDRALHAAIVILARHLVPSLLHKPDISEQDRLKIEVFVDQLVERARVADDREADDVRRDALAFLDQWQKRLPLDAYWDDHKPTTSLLISAERAAAQRSAGIGLRGGARSTPNSMRDVEPSVDFRMVPGLRARGGN